MNNRKPTDGLVLDFTPVPRRSNRHDGWTVARQRGFIEALADTGSVKYAANRVNMTPEGAYNLRRQPGADEFRAAWTAALGHGVQRLTDLAIDRAVEGVAVPIMYKGEQVGERHQYNDRLLTWILRHHAPNPQGDGANVPPHVRARREQEARIEAEAAEDRQSAGISLLVERLLQTARRMAEYDPSIDVTNASAVEALIYIALRHWPEPSMAAMDEHLATLDPKPVLCARCFGDLAGEGAATPRPTFPDFTASPPMPEESDLPFLPTLQKTADWCAEHEAEDWAEWDAWAAGGPPPPEPGTEGA